MLVCFSVDCFPNSHMMTWVDKNCDHFCKNFPSLAFGALWSEEQSVKHFKWDFANCLTCPRWGEDQTDEYFPVLWPHTHIPSPRVPAPSLPRLITSYMNSSLKLIAYKRVANSFFEALTNYIFSNWNFSFNTKYWRLMIKIQIGEQTWFDRSPPYFSSLRFIIPTSTNAFENASTRL